MKIALVIQHKLFKPALGAVLAVLCGLALWATPLGDGWVNASYDYLFLLDRRPVTSNVALVLMDNPAHDNLVQVRGQLWDRALHAELLRKLATNGCRLVVFDVHFELAGAAEIDGELAAAMRQQGNVVLMAKVADPSAPGLEIAQIIPPHELFVKAATHWGIANAGVEELETPRQHWPFPSPDEFPNLPWVAATQAGATLSEKPEQRWLRYYTETGGWDTWSYHLALTNESGYFRDKIVFIGSDPEFPNAAERWEVDKFSTPRTRWTKRSAGGVQVMATTFLNLMNGDWLRRPAPWVEALILIMFGGFLGGGLCRVPRLVAGGIAAGVALAVTLGGVLWSHHTNYWFPWLVIVGGQVPVALIWALVPVAFPKKDPALESTVLMLEENIPGYTLIEPPFGEGGFGKVWLAQSAIGQWQALKKVYRSNFKGDRAYEMEFEGVKKYKPVSEQHPALLRVEFISRMKPEGYFYYVMELGEAQEPGWEAHPTLYKPRTLSNVRLQHPGSRMPVRDCAQIGIVLAEALDYLHSHELTHRDVKPSNVIFVNGRPKLADVGLVTEARLPGEEASRVGTLGYMPPPPEPQGTKQADIYALGMLLYVISSGSEPVHFPDLPSTLLERSGHEEFIRLDIVILKACQPDRAQRYASAADLRSDLLKLQEWLAARAAEDHR